MECALRRPMTQGSCQCHRNASKHLHRKPTLQPEALPYAASGADATAVDGGQLLDSLQEQLQTLQQLQLPEGGQGLQAVQQYGSQAAAAAAATWSSLISPFAVFGDAWLLNLLFLGSISLLVYSLLILAPRQ